MLPSQDKARVSSPKRNMNKLKILSRKEVVLSLLFLMAVFLFQIKEVSEMLLWSSDLFEKKEFWRVISGNFTHTNVNHLLLNCTAFFIIVSIFKPSIKETIFIIMLLSFMIGLLMFNTDTIRFAGLSGVLHGYFIYLCLKDAFKRDYACIVAGLIAIGKVIYEQVYGASEQTEKLINAPVAIDGHMYGIISGVAIYIFLFTVSYSNIRKACIFYFNMVIKLF